jgi:hypothetical protein
LQEKELHLLLPLLQYFQLGRNQKYKKWEQE